MTGPAEAAEGTLLRLYHGGPAAAAALDALCRADPAAAALAADWDRQDAALRALYAPLGEAPVPDRLRAVLSAPAPAPRPALRRVAAAFALAAAAAATGVAAGWIAAGRGEEGAAYRFAEDALRAHAVFAADADRPVELPAGDPGLAAWLSARTGLALTPPDLGSAGFALQGGRIVPAGDGAAAMLLYDGGGGTRLSLFLAPAPEGADASAWADATAPGLRAVTWAAGGILCTVAGDLPEAELRRIARLALGQLG